MALIRESPPGTRALSTARASSCSRCAAATRAPACHTDSGCPRPAQESPEIDKKVHELIDFDLPQSVRYPFYEKQITFQAHAAAARDAATTDS